MYIYSNSQYWNGKKKKKGILPHNTILYGYPEFTFFFTIFFYFTLILYTFK